MIIKKITFRDYRNFKEETIEFSPGVNIITGENAQGKTNLIEGIYMTSVGKSFRTSKDRDMIMFGADYCSISADFSDTDTEHVEIVISKDGKKAAKIDGRKISKTSELLGNIICVAFTPDDLKIVKEDPSKRRDFIDRELARISLSYFDDLKKYRRALTQRNAFLKESGVVRKNSSDLDIWDEILSVSGSRIMMKRENFIGELSDISSRIHDGITQGREELSVRYARSLNTEASDSEDIRKDFYEALVSERNDDIKKGFTKTGPHRDDLEILINGRNTRKFGSQGQQRTAALSLKLAEIDIIRQQTGENPILLLDDVLSELDTNRQEYMIKTLSDIQMMITTTELSRSVLEEIEDPCVIKIKNGTFFRE